MVFQLFLILAGFLTTIIDLNFFKYTLTGQPVSDIFNILTIVPIYALSFRRLHDIGKSGWWVLLQLTIIGIIPLYIGIVNQVCPLQRKLIRMMKSCI